MSTARSTGSSPTRSASSGGRSSSTVASRSTVTPPCPQFRVSHGCVRVSDEAIDWIWADNMIPLGTEVWVYG